LGWFNWVCWIAPNNIVVNNLFGYVSGLGMGFLTFDWAMISYFRSPLVIPISLIQSTFESTFLTVSLVVGPSEHHGFVPVLVLVHRPDPLLHEHLELHLHAGLFPSNLHEYFSSSRLIPFWLYHCAATFCWIFANRKIISGAV
jgi:hypothetical protein